jgi:hypothetical protein
MTKDQDTRKSKSTPKKKQEVPLCDELGIEDLSDPVMGGRGRLFSAAGRESPIAELTEDFVLLYPPQNPFSEEEFDDSLTERVSARGVLLNAIGIEVLLPGARFRGFPIYCLAKRDSETGKRLVAYFDQLGDVCHLMCEGHLVTHNEALRLRNKTHNGELSKVTASMRAADL